MSSAPSFVAPVPADTPLDTTSSELDAIARLGDEIATLSAHIHAATHRLLTLIAEFDRVRGWEVDGQRSCAHWLALRTGIDLGAAREKVRAARALVQLPLTSAAMSRGELSFSHRRSVHSSCVRSKRPATHSFANRGLRPWQIRSATQRNVEQTHSVCWRSEHSLRGSEQPCGTA